MFKNFLNKVKNSKLNSQVNNELIINNDILESTNAIKIIKYDKVFHCLEIVNIQRIVIIILIDI